MRWRWAWWVGVSESAADGTVWCQACTHMCHCLPMPALVHPPCRSSAPVPAVVDSTQMVLWAQCSGRHAPACAVICPCLCLHTLSFVHAHACHCWLCSLCFCPCSHLFHLVCAHSPVCLLVLAWGCLFLMLVPAAFHACLTSAHSQLYLFAIVCACLG